MFFFFFFKQKTAYEMRISDWSSDVCSSDLGCTSANGACPPCASTWCSARSVKNSKASSRRRARNSANTCISTSNDGSASSITCVGGGGSVSFNVAPTTTPSVPSEIGRAHVGTPVTNAQSVCSLLIEKNNKHQTKN